MGDVTDMILEGLLCQSCGQIMDDHQSPGYPRDCPGCDGVSYSAYGRYLLDQKELRKKQKVVNRQQASSDFQQAASLANLHGLRLKMCSEFHYQLEHLKDRWLYNLYPGNTRIWADPKRPRFKYLKLSGRRWTLMEVVQAAVAVMQEQGGGGD